MAAHLVGVFFLLAAAVLLIIVSVGTPIWDSIDFLRADIGNQVLKLGQWGYCLGDQCTSSTLGYQLNILENYASGDTSARVAATITRGLTYALILHPIAAGITLVALLLGVCNNIVSGIIGSLISFFAFLVTLVALGIDLGLFMTARHRINDEFDNADARLSIGIWLVVASVILQLLAACTVCFVSRSNKRRRDVERSAAPVVPPMHEKRHFWQRRNKAIY